MNPTSLRADARLAATTLISPTAPAAVRSPSPIAYRAEDPRGDPAGFASLLRQSRTTAANAGAASTANVAPPTLSTPKPSPTTPPMPPHGTPTARTGEKASDGAALTDGASTTGPASNDTATEADAGDAAAAAPTRGARAEARAAPARERAATAPAHASPSTGAPADAASGSDETTDADRAGREPGPGDPTWQPTLPPGVLPSATALQLSAPTAAAASASSGTGSTADPAGTGTAATTATGDARPGVPPNPNAALPGTTDPNALALAGWRAASGDGARFVLPALADGRGNGSGNGDPDANPSTGKSRIDATDALAGSTLAAWNATAPLDAGNASATAPTAANISAGIDTPDFAQELAFNLGVLTKDGVQQAELHLNPAEMGPVSVQIALDGTQARIDFGADIAATRQAIEAGLPQLASALQQAGYTLAGGGVSQHGAGQSSNGRSSSDRRDGSGRTSAIGGTMAVDAGTVARLGEAARRATTRGGLDLFA